MATPEFTNITEALQQGIMNAQINQNIMWVVLTGAMVILMQLGFLLLEAGLTRSKNSISTAMKNFADFMISVPLFWLCGFGIMFGASYGGLIGTNNFMENGTTDFWWHAFFMFQVAFCGTAATIVSGAVAERMKFGMYLVVTALVVVLIYPVFGHWAWGKGLIADNTPWLASMGYLDFAGSSVVHIVGAGVALAALIIMGARQGKFNADGTPNTIHGHSPILTAAGGLVLLFGWIGFNGGSTLLADGSGALVITNTLLGGTMGGFITMLLGRARAGTYLPEHVINGMLAGLVAITASALYVTPLSACIIGMIGGVASLYAAEFLEKKCKIDDAVSAVAVHGVGGILGILLVPAFADPKFLVEGSRLAQLQVQIIGMAACILWSFGVGYLVLKTLDKIWGLRISSADEEKGQNVSEHNAVLGTGLLLEKIHQMQQGKFDLRQRFDASLGDEAAEMAVLLNPFMDSLQRLVLGLQAQSAQLGSSSNELWNMSKNLTQASDEISNASRLAGTASSNVVQRINSTSELTKIMREQSQRMGAATEDMQLQMKNIYELARDICQKIGNIKDAAQGVGQITGKASKLSSAAIVNVEALVDASKQIGSVIKLIEDIAAKTNLLALNASIEAKRVGGSEGQGFAVVAKEIRELAKRTTNATEEIRGRVEKIQGDSGLTVLSIKSIYDTINTMSKNINNIVESIHDQNHQTMQIVQSVEHANDKAESVNQTIKGVIGDLARVTENTDGIKVRAHDLNVQIMQMQQHSEMGLETALAVEKASTELAQVAREMDTTTKQKFVA